MTDQEVVVRDSPSWNVSILKSPSGKIQNVSWKWILAHQYYMLAAEGQRRFEWEVEAQQIVEQRTWGNSNRHSWSFVTDTWVSFTDYSKRNSHVSNYNLYVTVCCGTPMLSFIVSIFLCFHFILFIRKEKMTISLLLSSFYISFVSLQ